MPRVAFMGAGSTIFAKNVLGDCILTPEIPDLEIALFDIDPVRLEDSRMMLENISKNAGREVVIRAFSDRKEALRGASYVVNAIQVGGYDPCTITDFEIPKKYGLRQTIADTLGVGGIFRALRTIAVLEEFAEDMAQVCPDALFINYSNPMAMLTGYLQRYTQIRTVGLCHSVQVCIPQLFKALDMEKLTEETKWDIAGINHQAWLLRVEDRNGKDLYPEIKRRAFDYLDGKAEYDAAHDKVRFEIMRQFGYYVTESSEHNAEYTPWFIKSAYPELIERYNIPLDEYPRRCVEQIKRWNSEKEQYLNGEVTHSRTREYAAGIMNAIVTDEPYKIGGNVLNSSGLIPNLPREACVEVACLVNRAGVQPCAQPPLPVQLAAMNMTEINVHLLTIEAAVTRRKEHIYQAAMLDPHCSSELSIDDIVKMCDDLIETHGDWLPKYH